MLGSFEKWVETFSGSTPTGLFSILSGGLALNPL
jgi:hypothetical protein